MSIAALVPIVLVELVGIGTFVVLVELQVSGIFGVARVLVVRTDLMSASVR